MTVQLVSVGLPTPWKKLRSVSGLLRLLEVNPIIIPADFAGAFKKAGKGECWWGVGDQFMLRSNDDK